MTIRLFNFPSFKKEDKFKMTRSLRMVYPAFNSVFKLRNYLGHVVSPLSFVAHYIHDHELFPFLHTPVPDHDTNTIEIAPKISKKW
jgi:hypothetical protein